MRNYPVLALLAAVVLLSGCAPPPETTVRQGVADLRSRSWSRGPVVLSGTWEFNWSFRPVPDRWEGAEAGGRDGRGSGVYKVRVLVPEGSPPLALRYGTASTAFSVRAGGQELARVGTPDPDPARAVPAYKPGTVRLPAGDFTLEIFVSNHIYRIGGLWRAPVLGPADTVEADRWNAEALSVGLAATMIVLGFITLVFLLYLRSPAYFFSMVFALLVALRALVTGEYTLVRIFPGLSFDHLIRLEYLSAYLPLPVAVFFFSQYFPRLLPRWVQALLAGIPLAFAPLIPWAPVDLLTRSINFYYPFAIVIILVLTSFIIARVRREKDNGFLFAGTVLLAVSGLVDMSSAFFFARTGYLLPWGLAGLVILQSAGLGRQFIKTFEETRHLLEEKEILVKEIHHRVKNSLQVVASLVTLQSNRSDDPDQKAVYQALRRRITAIALVHEKLYGKGGGRPDVGEYLRELLVLHWTGDALDPGRVTWTVHAEPLAARDEFCIDAGLILTELVGNGRKHGGPARDQGRVEVEVRISEGRLVLDVADDGPGFPEGFQPEGRRGLGFRLVLALLARNDGAIEFRPGPGGRVIVSLRLPTAAG